MEPEKVFINANILTLDENNNIAGSIAVSGNKIIQIYKEKNPDVATMDLQSEPEIIDLGGRTVIPGFIDTHNHILAYAQLLDFVNCSSPLNKNIEDILQAIKAKIDLTKEGEWVQGFGYDDTMLEEKRHLTREELDRFAPNHPVAIAHISGHLAVVNSKALSLAGLEDNVEDPDAGYYGRDENGKLNGVLFESAAMQPVMNVLPVASKEQMIAQLGRAAKHYLAQGITTNTDAAVGMLGDPEKEIQVHTEAARQGINPMRSRLMIMHNLLQKGMRFEDYTAEELDKELIDKSNENVRLDSAKLFQDGSIQAFTAALREPYYSGSKEKAKIFQKQDAFNKEILNLHERGFRIAVHGNGDRAIESILDAYAYAIKEAPRKEHKHRIEHVQTAMTKDIKRMEELDVAGSFFINHVYYWGERHAKIFLGPDRASRMNPLAEAVEHNLLFTLHSDCPVTPISPLFSIWAAVNRCTTEGNILGPKQRIDVITALKSMTIYGARLNFDEDNSGSIEVGKRADFVLLDKDPTVIDPIKIKDISVEETWIGGNQVYKQEID